MKKGIKTLLAWSGIVAIGIIAYELFKKTDGEVQKISAEEKSKNDSTAAACLSTQEFIERRKERAAKMREAQRAAKESEPLTSLDFNNTDTVTKETGTSNITVEAESAVDSQITEVSGMVENTTKSE